MKNAETELLFFVSTQEVREMVAPVLKSFQAQVSHISPHFTVCKLCKVKESTETTGCPFIDKFLFF